MGMPAARVTDMHVCPMSDGPKPHVGGPILPPCQPNVLTGSLPQARVGDMCTCVGPPDAIAMGAFTVLVGGKPAARILDTTLHGGKIVAGLPTVLIGDSGGGGAGGGGAGSVIASEGSGIDPAAASDAMIAAAKEGAPFCEQCMKS